MTAGERNAEILIEAVRPSAEDVRPVRVEVTDVGGNVQSLLGTKASSFLTKATSVCAILFLFTCIGLNVLEVRKSRSLFQAPQDQAPLDVNQIKKALEKLKKVDAAKSATSATASTTKTVTAAKTGTATAAAKPEVPKR